MTDTGIKSGHGANPWQREPFKAFYAYWKSLPRKGDCFPERQSFNPMRLPKLVTNLWVAERCGEEVVSRLIGTSLTDRESLHLEAGASFRALSSPEDYRTFVDALVECQKDNHLIFITTRRNEGGLSVGYQMLLLPFAREDGERQQFIALEIERAGERELEHPSDFPVYDIGFTLLDMDLEPV